MHGLFECSNHLIKIHMIIIALNWFANMALPSRVYHLLLSIEDSIAKPVLPLFPVTPSLFGSDISFATSSQFLFPALMD